MLGKVVLICAFIVLSIVRAHAQNATESRVVTIAQGPVRGYKDSDTDVFVFYHIPYAEAPKGADKFKAPLPAPSWNETFEAVNRRILCPQNIANLASDSRVYRTEDCLVANVFVPDTNDTNLPVLVIVHGGAYFRGHGNSRTPKALVNSKKLIAVSFNYRLGIPGFLCLGTPDVPGNAGMKDQVALLRWVRDNIASFGGNPNDVTVNGCSAGGVSVDLLLLSKLTDGLMNKVIPESGSSLGPFGVQYDPLQDAKDYARQFNFTNVEDINALENFYKSLSFEQMTEDSDFLHRKDSTFPLAPCIERDVGQEMFLEDAPIKILRNKNYNMMPSFYGYASFEGMFRLSVFDDWKVKMNEKFSDFMPADLSFESDVEKEQVANAVRQYYFGNNTVSDSTILPYINYCGDSLFIHSILRSVSEQVKAGNKEVYLLEYWFIHDLTPSIPHTDARGPNHCQQSVAAMDEDESVLPEDYIAIKKIVRDLWLNFITTGNPRPTGFNTTLPAWPPSEENRSPHYHIGETIHADGAPLQGAAALWDDIYEKHIRIPISPPNSASTICSKVFILLATLTLILRW